MRECRGAIAVGVLVGSSIAYPGAKLTSGVGLGVDSGAGVGISRATALLTGDDARSADQFSGVGRSARNCRTPKAIAQVVEIVASPIADHARR